MVCPDAVRGGFGEVGCACYRRSLDGGLTPKAALYAKALRQMKRGDDSAWQQLDPKQDPYYYVRTKAAFAPDKCVPPEEVPRDDLPEVSRDAG